jgi:hypothetical protein
MQEAMGVGMDLLVALNAVHVEAHAANCLCKDLCDSGNRVVAQWGLITSMGKGKKP